MYTEMATIRKFQIIIKKRYREKKSEKVRAGDVIKEVDLRG